jgi:excisionase family DNA binding protein
VGEGKGEGEDLGGGDRDMTLHNKASIREALSERILGDRFLTTIEAARILRRHPETIRRWIRGGILRARRIPSTRLYLIEDSEIRRLLGGGGDEG